MIVTRFREVYRRGIMAARLIRLLTVLALLVAPVTMVGEHAAMAMTAAPDAFVHHAATADQAGHCAEMSGQLENETAPDSDCPIDCAIACSAIPVVGSQMAGQPITVAIDRPLPLVGRISGLNPESDPPPPRVA